MRFLLCLFASPLIAHGAALDPSWKFQVLRSPNFELIYREDQKELAKRYVLAAEQAHELLFPIFKEGPSKTIIVLKDYTDSSNGLATFLPYPHITIYPVLPSTLDSVDEFGDWPLEMMLHEYTHILNMYPAHGFYVPLKWIFGTVTRPNALLPRWYLEGLAVNLESQLSSHGRLRSTESAAAARALILGSRLRTEDVATINEGGISSWPYGGRPYMFGGWWWENVHRQKGAGIIETWNQNFSRRLPFLLNGPVHEQMKKSVHDLVGESATTLEAQGEKQLAAIRASGPHKGEAIVEAEGEQSVFAVSPSGKYLVYLVSSAESGSQIRLKIRGQPGQNFGDTGSERLFKTVGTLRVRWMNDEVFVFDQLDIVNPYTTFRDLYSFDLKTREKTRLTRQARAQEPGPSPSGKFVAFIQNDGGRNRLSLLDLSNRTIKPLINGSFAQRIAGPEFISENEIVFAVRQKSGNENLHVYDLTSRQSKPWNTKLNSAQNPRMTPEGLLVTNADTRIRNVYLLKNGDAKAVSNTLTDIQTADFDPQKQEVIVSELTSSGRRLRKFPLSPYNPPTIDPPALGEAPKATTSKVKLKEESYLPAAYLLPRYWIPFVYQVEEGLIFQGLTSNQDPAGRNMYSLLASFDTVTNKPSYGISYLNRSLPTDIGMSYGKSVSYLAASELTLESESAALNLSNYWPFNSRYTTWQLGGVWDQTESSVNLYRRLGPELAIRYSKLNSPLNERWGVHAEISHQEYLEQGDYIAYGRTYAGFATHYRRDNGHRISLQSRGALSPELPARQATIDLGDRSLGGNYLVNLANSRFLLRGYPSGTFMGRKVVNANLEYALPALSLNKGLGTFPLFLRGLELAAFADTMAVDGFAINSETNRYNRSTLSEFYTGAGAELRINTTTAYHVPLSVTVGAYYGFEDRYGGGFSPFFGIGFGGLSALEDKKH